jgi:hypothetical protein
MTEHNKTNISKYIFFITLLRSPYVSLSRELLLSQVVQSVSQANVRFIVNRGPNQVGQLVRILAWCWNADGTLQKKITMVTLFRYCTTTDFTAGLEITFPTFPITVISNHDFFPIK